METTLLHGDCLQVLRTLPDESVQCCVTSPPYYAIRDYGTARWAGGDANCEHRVRDVRTGRAGSDKQASNVGSVGVCSGDCRCGAIRIDEQIGLEQTPDAYIAKLVSVFHEAKRVLRVDGVLWVNIADSYYGSASTGGIGKETAYTGKRDLPAKRASGLKPKDCIGIPWMLAFALRADGWYLRSDCIWHKPNAMPESVRDRPTKSHEYLFLLSKSERYYYDAQAIAEPATDAGYRTKGHVRHYESSFFVADPAKGRYRAGLQNMPGGRQTRNRRTVWSINTKPCKEAHFAVMPPALVEPCILAGSRPGDVILDPFAGAGTVGVVAVQHGRSFTGIELNADYLEIARRRIAAAAERSAAECP